MCNESIDGGLSAIPGRARKMMIPSAAAAAAADAVLMQIEHCIDVNVPV
jgi:hypothetical protein